MKELIRIFEETFTALDVEPDARYPGTILDIDFTVGVTRDFEGTVKYTVLWDDKAGAFHIIGEGPTLEAATNDYNYHSDGEGIGISEPAEMAKKWPNGDPCGRWS